MGLEFSSAWSTPRGWKLISLTLFVLTLLLVVPLQRLSDDTPGFYGHLTKYLSHEGAAYDVEEGFIANLNTTDTSEVVNENGPADSPGEGQGQSEGQGDHAGEHQNNGENGKEAQNDDNKSVEDEQLQTDYGSQENADNKPEEKDSDASAEAEGAGGPLQDDDEAEDGDKQPESEADKTEGNNDKLEGDESKADGAGGLIQEDTEPQGDDKKPEDGSNKSEDGSSKPEGEDSKTGGDDQKPETIVTSEDQGNSDSQNNDDGSNETETETKTNGLGNLQTTSSSVETKPTEAATVESPAGPSGLKGACEGFPNTDGILLVMKTGATEAYTKLPTHLLTSLQCLPDVLIFSDLEQKIGNFHIYDVLQDVKDDVKQGRKEFDLYKSQIDCPIPQQYCTSEMKGGWDLDKYKFLHMIERAWAMRPNMEWYVFAEADSYVFWSNLVWYLRNKVNGTETPYVGSVAMLKNTPFAHGGSGYVIHGETVKKMVDIPDLAHKYDQMATHECCGDYLMALAVMETGKKVRQAHPLFNGEKPVSLPFGNGHWCEPLLTMHHMNPEEVSSVWHYEQTREKKGPLQIKEMYEAFWAPNMEEKHDEWDNLSDDVCYIGVEPEAQSKASDHQKSRQKKEDQKSAVEQRAHHSMEHCSKVCEAEGLGITDDEYFSLSNDEERNALIKAKYEQRKDDKDFHGSRRCFQWRYHKNVCCIARSFKNGKPRKEAKPEEKWTSGWFVRGINDWIAAKGDCEPRWKEPS